MRVIRILSRLHYDTVYEAGAIVSHLADRDCDNLVAGGYAEDVEDAATINPIPEEGQAPAGGSGQEEPREQPPRTGPDAPAAAPASQEPAQPDSLACPHGCRGGQPFKSLAALVAHLKTKH